MWQIARMAGNMKAELQKSTSPDAPMLAQSMADIQSACIHATQQLISQHKHEAVQSDDAE